MRASRRRNTATGRTSLFSNLVFCGDCGSKMYFCASKSINENQEFFSCSAYKENRGTCTIHFIRNVVLEEMVLETVRKTAKYISENETVFLYLYEKNHRLSVAKELRDTKLRMEQAKKRIKELEIFNSVKGEDGKKHVPITIHFRSVDIVTVPDEEEIIAAMEEIRNNPTKVA